MIITNKYKSEFKAKLLVYVLILWVCYFIFAIVNNNSGLFIKEKGGNFFIYYVESDVDERGHSEEYEHLYDGPFNSFQQAKVIVDDENKESLEILKKYGTFYYWVRISDYYVLYDTLIFITPIIIIYFVFKYKKGIRI